MITLLGICCNQWEPILQQTKEERERIKKIRCRKEANAARDELNLPWKEACCPSCKKTGYLRVYDIYEHPVGAGFVPHDGPLSFLRLKCHKCETTHAVFPEDYIPFSSDSRFYYCMGVYTMPCKKDTASSLETPVSPRELGLRGQDEPRKTSLFNRFQGILSFKGDIQDAIEDKEEGLFFYGEALPKPVLRRDLEVSPEISVSSRYNHKFRIDEYLENAWEALVNLGYVAKTAFPCRREAIRQILIHPLAGFLEAFNDLCPFLFLCPCEPFLKNERGLTHGCFRYKAV